MRRHAEGLLERPAEIIGTQTNESREGLERDLLGEVLLDKGVDDPLLPAGETAARGSRFDPASARIDAHQLVRQHDTKSFEIGPIVRARALEQLHQLERSIPERGILKEQPWLQRGARIARIRMFRHLGGVKIEIHYPCETTRLLPLVIFVAGRHKGELSFAVAQRRSRRTPDDRFAVATRGVLIEEKQMIRSASASLHPFKPCRLTAFARHAVPSRKAALHGIEGRDLHRWFDLL